MGVAFHDKQDHEIPGSGPLAGIFYARQRDAVDPFGRVC